MEVYVELALAENFCMDWVLLYCAKAVTKNNCSYRKITFTAAVGACMAVVFPLLPTPVWLSVIIKIVGGALLCLLCVKHPKILPYLKFAAAFFGFSFALGGGLIALFSFTNLSQTTQNGYYLSKIPVGIPLFFALLCVLAAKCLGRRLSLKKSNDNLRLQITCGGAQTKCAGFYDSGNKVFYCGSPVTVIPPDIAKKLCNVNEIKTFVQIHTVAGSKKMPIFTADKVEINDGKKAIICYGVKLGVSPSAIERAVVHPELSEG